jgi:hypothetical protein
MLYLIIFSTEFCKVLRKYWERSMDIKGRYIIDEQGRTLILRGCNLGGSSKYPLRPGSTNRHPDSLKDPQTVSFVGRPFPLEAAEAHFDQLSRWGFTFIRFLITWEALEHAGPGCYDEAYLAYLRKILRIAGDKGFSVVIDPHQDVWSRWTGGDGAPAWTLDTLGMDRDQLDPSGAALTQQHYGALHGGAPFPRMIWSTNYNRYATATMFTLFFAGNTYAPDLSIDGESIQDWLQERYLACMRHCFRRLKDCTAIIGWGAMNEPHPGFIGYHDLSMLENCSAALGPMPSPFQAMSAASGHPVTAPEYTTDIWGRRIVGQQTLNPGALSLFKPGFTCPWKQAGVWTDEGGVPRLLRPDHFAAYQGKPARFTEDFLKPFMNRFAERIRELNNRTFFFIEGIPNGMHPTWSSQDAPKTVNAFHWYDGPTLFTKSFRSWITLSPDPKQASRGKLILGRKNVAAYFTRSLTEVLTWTGEHMGDMPCLLGEFGLPFDMNRGRAFKTGDYHLHEEALSLYYDAVDANLLHSTIWNYTADNTHEEGDGWNDEDLSIVSGGAGRALKGWLRPYPMATAGTPLRIHWDRKTGILSYRFRTDPRITVPTELFIPPEWFGPKPGITIRLDPPEGTQPVEAAYKPELGRIFLTNNGYEGVVDCIVSR